MLVRANQSPLYANMRELHVWNLDWGSNSKNFPDFPQSVQENNIILPRLEHCRFSSHPLQFIIHQSS
jgi:hypothetical protein